MKEETKTFLLGIATGLCIAVMVINLFELLGVI